MEQEKLATELLHELKQTSKRWFVAFIVVLILWFLTIGAFLWYISLPIEEVETYVEQSAEYGERNIQTFVGGNNYGETSGQEEVQAESE